MKDQEQEYAGGGLDVAIIGMAGRFPGAEDIPSFWRNLEAGVESIVALSHEEVLAAGVPPDLAAHPDYVKRAPDFQGADRFDAAFFGYGAEEASLLDPQNRQLLECAWEAFEAAGYDPRSAPGPVGVYASKAPPFYMIRNLGHLLRARNGYFSPGNFPLIIDNERDFLATRISYKLDLKGPSLTVAAACGSSLLAVHLACQSLITGECQMALAGSATVLVPHRAGHLYDEGLILSRDGHCRAFDAAASGTVFGSGAAAVLLKRLEDALADGDHIHAVIKGSAANKDGGYKASFAAPSGRGQATAAAEALANAGVSADSIGYVEAHGTGTKVGDPIELGALTEAFRATTQRRRFCGIGSVKTNIGHLDATAGIAGLIKTVLMLEHGALVPSLHFEHPNPQIDFDRSPFYVVTERVEWKRGPTPRRAGVSAFGIGGTNVHLVVEEAPPVARPSPASDRSAHLLCLSARSEEALRQLAARHATHLEGSRAASLGDVCFTASSGRAHFDHRLAVVAASTEEMRARLAAYAAGQRAAGLVTGSAGGGLPRVGFLFTGQGSQYAGMGRALYEAQPTFRAALDECDALLRSHLDRPLLSLLFPPEGEESLLERTRYTQPALCALQHALVVLWRSWGVEPAWVMGHSVGEIGAAMAAGALDLESGLRLAAARGRAMQELPPGGAMTAVLAGESVVAEAIASSRGQSGSDAAIAAVNGPAETVISGATEAVQAVIDRLLSKGIQARRLVVSHAFHSALMEPALDAIEQAAAQVRFHSPRIPLIANLTGRPIAAGELSARYFRRHAREAVRFADGLAALHARGEVGLVVEIGPHPVLSAMGRQIVGDDGALFTPSLRRGEDAWRTMLSSLGELYARGVAVDWKGFDRDHARRRVPLPTYPFQRQRYWIEPPAADVRDGAPLARASIAAEEPHGSAEPGPAAIKKGTPRAALLAAAPEARPALLAEYLRELVALRTGHDTTRHGARASLRDLGLDSLRAAELKRAIATDLGESVPVAEMIGEMTLIDLRDRLLDSFTALPEGSRP